MVGTFLVAGVVLIAKPPSIFGTVGSTYDVIGKLVSEIFFKNSFNKTGSPSRLCHYKSGMSYVCNWNGANQENIAAC